MDPQLIEREEANSISSSKTVGSHYVVDSPYLDVDTSHFEVGSLLRAAAQYDVHRSEFTKAVLLEKFFRAAASVTDQRDVEELQKIIKAMIEKGGCMETLGPDLLTKVSLEDKALNELLASTYGRIHTSFSSSFTSKRDEPVSHIKMNEAGEIAGYDTQYHIEYPQIDEDREYMESAVKELFDFIVEYDATRTTESEMKVNEYFIKAALKARDEKDIEYIYKTVGQLNSQGGIAYQVLDRNEKILDLDMIKNYRRDLDPTALEGEEKQKIDEKHYNEFRENYDNAVKYLDMLDAKQDKGEDLTKEELEECQEKVQAAEASLEVLGDFYTEEEMQEFRTELKEQEIVLQQVLEEVKEQTATEVNRGMQKVKTIKKSI